MKFKNILYFIISIFFFASCVEDISLPLENGTKMLVVEGGLTTDAISHKIMLSLTNDFYDTERPAAVSGATVTLSDGENTYTLTETGTAGTYRTPVFAAEIGKTYRLEISDVNIDGTEKYWAEASIDYQISPLDSIKISNIKRIDTIYNKDKTIKKTDTIYYVNRENYLPLFIFLKDQKEVRNFYLGKVAVNDTLLNDTISRYFYTDDMLFNGSYVNDNIVSVYRFKTKLTGERDDYRILRPNSKVTVYAYGISKDYYYFISDINSTGSANPFMGPPTPPRSNIFPAGKACGFFYAMSSTQYSMIYLP